MNEPIVLRKHETSVATAVFLLLALDDQPLTIPEIRAVLETWDVEDMSNNVSATISKYEPQRRFCRRGRTVTLGPHAPLWAQLIASAPPELRAQWRKELERVEEA